MNEQTMSKPQPPTPNLTRPRCFIVTVGTSLLSQYLKGKEKNWSGERIEGAEGSTAVIVTEYHEKKIKNGTSCYAQAYSDLCGEFRGYTGVKELQEASAELNSLYHLEPLPGHDQKDVVILFATRTPTGCLCATLLKDVLRNPPNGLTKVGCVCIKQPEGLGLAKDPDFAKKGLPSFLGDLSECIRKYQENNTHEVVLIPTGGYKSLIPYVTLAGILHGVPVKYIYEESKVLLDLPPVPVGLDMEQWQTGALILKQITRLKASEAAAWRASLQPGFSSLIKSGDKTGEYTKLTGLGDWLVRRYEDQEKTPLQAQTGRQALLRFVHRDSGKKDLKEMFRQLVKIGPYLWTGDKIPEMVDHGPYHHTNLFAMADLMLVPILHKWSKFMTPEEVFIFLCVVYFHDCGHVLPSFSDGRVLLPTQVRKYHHILGYERLNNQAWQKTLIDNGLTWENCPEKLWSNYLHVIAAIAMFHRREMPLQSGVYECYARKDNGKHKEYPSLRDDSWNLAFEGNSLLSERAVFLAALFRVLDGLDNQVARTGTPEELGLKAAAVQADAEAYERHAAEVLELLGNNGIKEQAKTLVATIMGSHRGDGKNEDVDRQITAMATGTGCPEGLIRLYIEAATRAAFKREQGKHYLDHLILDMPEIIATPAANQDDCHTIKVTLRPIPETTFEDYRQAYGKFAPGGASKCYGQTIADVTKKITSEYASSAEAPVPDILESGRLKIEYWLQQEKGSCIQLRPSSES